VWMSTIMVSLVAMLNQEFVMPYYASELQKTHDDDGTQKVKVSSRYDSSGILIHGLEADRSTRTLLPCNFTLPPQIFGRILELESKQAQYIPEAARRCPHRGGWLLRGAVLKPAIEDELLEDKDSPLIWLKNDKGFPQAYGGKPIVAGDTYFLRTNLDFDSVARSRDWYQYARTPELVASL